MYSDRVEWEEARAQWGMSVLGVCCGLSFDAVRESARDEGERIIRDMHGVGIVIWY